MINNVFLFTWENKYSLDTELKRRQDTFAQKYWSDSVFSFNSENRNSGATNQTIFWGGLFSTKKLIILRWIPTCADRQTWFDTNSLNDFTDKFIKSANLIPADNLVIFSSYSPDKRGRLYKFLEKECQIKEFKKFWTIELKNLIRSQLWEIKISESTMTFLINKIWDDPYRITSELDKIREYCLVHSISSVDENLVDELTFWQSETVAFGFMDILLKDTTKAIHYLSQIQQEWTNRNEFAGALYFQLKTNIILDDYFQRWIKDSKKIAAESGLNPRWLYINIKNINQISKNWNELRNMYKWLVQTDIGIKTGKIKEEEFWLNIKKLWLKFKA